MKKRWLKPLLFLKLLVLLSLGAGWILFSGLISIKLPPGLPHLPHTFTPTWPLDFKSPPPPTELSGFFSSLEERWRRDRLLATSA